SAIGGRAKTGASSGTTNARLGVHGPGEPSARTGRTRQCHVPAAIASGGVYMFKLIPLTRVTSGPENSGSRLYSSSYAAAPAIGGQRKLAGVVRSRSPSAGRGRTRS